MLVLTALRLFLQLVIQVHKTPAVKTSQALSLNLLYNKGAVGAACITLIEHF